MIKKNGQNLPTHDFEKFSRLLSEKKRADSRVEDLNKRVNALVEYFPDGIKAARQMRPEKKVQQALSSPVGDAVNHPEIWRIVCDASDSIVDVSANICEVLKYKEEELRGCYKGKLWIEKPSSADQFRHNKAAYLIYEVKQKHFQGAHEDAYISSSGQAVSVLQHRVDIKTGQNKLIGYLYLVFSIQESKLIDAALAEILKEIENELLTTTDIELTHEMKLYLVRDLVQTHEYVSSVMQNSIDAILVTSPAGLIISANHAFNRLVGLSSQELLNQPVNIVSPEIGRHVLSSGGTVEIDEDYFEKMAEMIALLFKTGRVYGFRQYFKNRDGYLIPAEINISLLKDRQGSIKGFVRNIHDLSENIRLEQEILHQQEQINFLKNEITLYSGHKNIIGRSPAMQDIFRLVAKVAETDTTALIQGESGTGKELIARALYYQSARSSGPFVVLNCGAIPQGLFESELFGHVKGAFTGAVQDKKGLFEEASGGVIFLDEIAEMSLDMQVKLLRAIQEREIKRVGDNRTVKIDVRIIAATHKDLLEETRKKRFREDLYYRINVITIKIPPLRDRREDIPLLIDFFVNKHLKGKKSVKISRDAMKALLAYPYPGNIRELENIVERALIVCEGGVVNKDDLPSEALQVKNEQGSDGVTYADNGLHQVMIQNQEVKERDIISRVLKETSNNKAVAARKLRIGRTSLYRKMKKYGLN